MKTRIALLLALAAGCTETDLGTTESEIIIQAKGSIFALQDGVCQPADGAAEIRLGGPDTSEFKLKGSNFTIEGLADPPELDPPDPDHPPDPGLTFVVRNAAGAIVFDSRRVR